MILIPLFLKLKFFYYYINSTTDCQILQERLDRLAQWADKWKMSFNPTKCEMMRTTNRIHPLCFSYKLKNHYLNKMSHAKYLGKIIDKRLTWLNRLDYITRKANQRNLTLCLAQVKIINCYRTFVRPTYFRLFIVPQSGLKYTHKIHTV